MPYTAKNPTTITNRQNRVKQMKYLEILLFAIVKKSPSYPAFQAPKLGIFQRTFHPLEGLSEYFSGAGEIQAHKLIASLSKIGSVI